MLAEKLIFRSGRVLESYPKMFIVDIWRKKNEYFLVYQIKNKAFNFN
jgi:uncharacterized protein Veg